MPQSERFRVPSATKRRRKVPVAGSWLNPSSRVSTMAATDVSDRNKRYLAGRAASRRETAMLSELRQAIERQTVPPRVASSIASSSVSGRPFSQIEKKARRAIKSGELEAARDLAAQYQRRLSEARSTIEAARAIGARVNKQVDTRARLQRDRLDNLRAQLRKAYRKREREQAKNG